MRGPANDFPYYRKLHRRTVAVLLLAALVPLLVVGGGLHVVAAARVEQGVEEVLRARVDRHRRAIDDAVAERVRAVELVADLLAGTDAEARGDLDAVLADLRRRLTDFVDVGVLNAEGRHLAYAGPYDLRHAGYRQAEWFRELADRDRVVTDLFLGHRGVPHFVIAVRREGPAGRRVTRATVDGTVFESLVASPSAPRTGDSFLVNREGLYQTKPLRGGERMQPWGRPPPERHEGVRLESENGRIFATAWLSAVPWMTVESAEAAEVFAPLEHVRRTAFVAFAAAVVLVTLAVLAVTGRLVRRLESDRARLRSLDDRIAGAGLAATSGRLARAGLEELRGLLGEMGMAAEVAAETLGGGEVDRVAATLRLAAERAREGRLRTEHLLALCRPPDPVPVPSEIELRPFLADLAADLAPVLAARSVSLRVEAPPELPAVATDAPLLRQLLVDLAFRAADGVAPGGAIELRLAPGTDAVALVVSRREGDPGIGWNLEAAAEAASRIGGALGPAGGAGDASGVALRLPLRSPAAAR